MCMFIPNPHRSERSVGLALFLFWMGIVMIPALTLVVH